MADYKRMVSYMYQYENGVKRKNVGYARVEAKNAQCKITLHMQLLGQLDSIFPTYLIQRDENNLDLIYLGDALLKNQVMDSKLTAAEDNIMGSGYGLSDIGGLLIFLNDNVFFATEWDDKPIVAKEVLEAMKPKPKKSTVSAEVEDNEVELKSEESQDKNMEELQAAYSIAVEGIQELSIEDEASIPKYKLPRGWKTVERLQKPYMAEPKQIDKIVEVVDVQTKERADDTEKKDNEVEKADTEADGNDNVDGKDNLDGNDNLNGYDNLDGNDSIEKRNMGIGKEAEDLPDPPTARQFFENYPRIYPFEDSEITLCVKIEPKDIGLLPKEIWVLSNNSFLMHGFYCYHHLIFAKMKDRFGCRYVLGIPGIYHNREKFMARMFGFESFKSIRKRELRQGDFGYWYLPIAL
ncbi:MAG: DUF6128 domain-containing protein [Mobilitalea sp.]